MGENNKRKFFSTPYSFSEKMSWLKNNLFGPSRRFKDLSNFLFKTEIINSISSKYRIAFIGDIMPMGERHLKFDPNLKKFLNNVDFLIGNFEGTISSAKKVFMAQAHNHNILKFLEDFFPPSKTILCLANNHSGDFGCDEFEESMKIIQDSGFRVIGSKNEPSILLDGINITNATRWSNQQCSYINYMENTKNKNNNEAVFNILLPHWGYELQLYPNPKQIELAKHLLETWDLIVGSHSHCPQPVINYGDKIVAYSLGDFCIGKKLKKYYYGMIVKVEIGPNKKGIWQIGELKWEFTKINHINKFETEISIEDKCRFFKEL